MIWGVIWFVQYLLGFLYLTFGFQLLGQHPDWVAGWITGVGLCVTLTYIFLKLRFANPIRSTGTWFEQWRAPLLTFVWFVFHFITEHLYHSENGWAMNAFDVSYWMLLFVVYGFWFTNKLFILVGGIIAVSAVLGYSLLPEQRYYALEMAVIGGGTLFVGGLYAKLKCRHKSGAEGE